MSLATRHLSMAGATALAAAALMFASAEPSAAQTPFSSIAGTWSGGGHLRLDNGSSERVKCRASYNTRDSGMAMGLSIRCASPSYKIELRSSLRYNGGAVSGTWEERQYNAGGSISGRATSNVMSLNYNGDISGSINISFSGSNQRVSISGTGINSVSLSLSRT